MKFLEMDANFHKTFAALLNSLSPLPNDVRICSTEKMKMPPPDYT